MINIFNNQFINFSFRCSYSQFSEALFKVTIEFNFQDISVVLSYSAINHFLPLISIKNVKIMHKNTQHALILVCVCVWVLKLQNHYQNHIHIHLKISYNNVYVSLLYNLDISFNNFWCRSITSLRFLFLLKYPSLICIINNSHMYTKRYYIPWNY